MVAPKLQGCRPKVKYFIENYPYELKSTEYVVKFPMIIHGKDVTYNPDFFCEKTGYFIEIATSKPNIYMQREKWREALRMNYKLKIFWWEGKNITKQIKNYI